VLEGRKPKGTHRVLSVADEAAPWIAKGNHVPVIGYKPRLARSGNGSVVAMLVPKGHAADSAMLLPHVREAYGQHRGQAEASPASTTSLPNWR